MRPRLYARLDAGSRSKLILISAPAGFGKTTLVADWLHAAPRDRKYCWFALDKGDNAPSTFWSYFISALRQANPKIGNTARAAFQSPQAPPIEALLTLLLNDIAAQAAPMLLALDDYHVITNQEIHHALDFLFDHLPQNFHLVITTRQDPPLALARLRARGQLSEIRAADLQFTPAETKEFLNQLMALDLSAQDIAALSERTEGWATGLRLAALSLQHENDKHSFVNAFTASHRFLTDYLLDEVLARQDPALELFLRRTCVLQRFSAALCDAVTGESNSQATLRRLEQSNLFLVPLDNARTWYRYHHLFAQFLFLRLQETEPQLAPQLYQRAITWCAANDLPREALTYALAARDWERAADLMESIVPHIFNTEGGAPVLPWLDALPGDLIRRRPYLCLHYAWAQTFLGKMSDALEYLDAAETALGAIENASDRETIHAYIAAQRAYVVFFRGDYMQTIAYARQALEHLPPDDEVMRARTTDFLGHGLRYAGDLEGAIRAHSQASSILQKTGNVAAVNVNLMSLAQVYLERGQLHLALATFERAIAYTREHMGSAEIPFTGFAFIGIGAIYREWNALESAVANMDKGVALYRAWQADTLTIGLMEQAFLFRDLQQYEHAREALEQARRIIGEMFSAWGIGLVNAFVAQIELARDDVAAAARWAQTSGLNIHDAIDFVRGDEYQTFAQVLCVQENFPDALVLFEKMYAQYASAKRYGRMIGMLVWQARALAGLGKHAQARETLHQAMSIGEPENYVRTFVNVGEPIADLLRQMPASAYRETLLDAFLNKTEMHVETTDAPVIVPKEWNEREIAVLRRMAAGKSNQEIGSEMYLSVNTIRWYASQIYLKLNVKGRGEAVARARELGIL